MANDNNESESKSITSGLKFNRMQEQTTTTIIKQKTDPARQMQIALGIGVAVLAFAMLAYISFVRSGLNPFQSEPEGHTFGAPTEHKITE